MNYIMTAGFKMLVLAAISMASGITIMMLSSRVGARMAKTLRFVDELGCECVYMCTFGGDKQIKVLSGKTDEPVLRIPYEGDPFHLSGRTAGWISNMLYKHLF